MKSHICYFLITLLFIGCKEKSTQKTAKNKEIKVVENRIKINPIEHATAILEWNNLTIYIDPVGDLDKLT